MGSDFLAFFSYNPGGIFSGGGMEGAGDFSGKKKSDDPAPSSSPSAPKPEDSLVKAQQEADKKRKTIAATGGQTQQTTTGNSYVQTNQVQLKSLLGGTQ